MGDKLTKRELLQRLRDRGHPELQGYQVEYALSQYSIEPSVRVGAVRLWDEAKIPVIESALRRIADRRGASCG
jgi:hypothetical protein